MNPSYNRLYNDLSYIWPIISPPHEYSVEAWHITEIIRQNIGHTGNSLLELGCGGGHILSHLTNNFTCTAVDISESMIKLSQELNPSVPHHIGDMRSVVLNQSFDAILIHDAINYMLSESDLTLAFTTANKHLNPSGVLILAPDWFSDTFNPPVTMHWTKTTDDGHITFIEYLDDSDKTDTTIESLFLYIINKSGDIQMHQDNHITGVFPQQTWLTLLKRIGFSPEIHNFPSYEGGFGGNLIIAKAL